jgi:hypothetical protein
MISLPPEFDLVDYYIARSLKTANLEDTPRLCSSISGYLWIQAISAQLSAKTL